MATHCEIFFLIIISALRGMKSPRRMGYSSVGVLQFFFLSLMTE